MVAALDRQHPLHSDTRGLVWAYRLDGTSEATRSVLLAQGTAGFDSDAENGSEQRLWMHFNLSDRRTRPWLEEHAAFPENVLSAFSDAEARVQVQSFGNALLLVLFDVRERDFKADPEAFGTLRILLDERRMITARSHPLHSVDVLRREVAAGAEIGSPVVLLSRLVHCLAETLVTLIKQAEADVDRAEDDILEGKHQAHSSKLAQWRRLLTRSRRHLSANRTVLNALLANLPSWFDAEHRRQVSQAAGRLEAVAQDLDLTQERARLLQEEIAARVSEATNRNLYVLSIVTTLMLPATLVTGIFGMNVEGLPWQHSPEGFLWICGLMTVTVGLGLWLLYRGRMV